MQRRIVKKLDASIRHAERDRQEHDARYYQASGSNRPRYNSAPAEEDPDYEYRQSTRQPYYQEPPPPPPPPQAPMRIPSPVRIAASFRQSQAEEYVQDPSVRDDDEDDLILTDEQDYPPPIRPSASYERDPDRDYNPRRSSPSGSKSKTKSKSREREKTYVPTKRPSRTRSITFEDKDNDDDYSGSESYGSSSSISSRGSRSGRSSRNHSHSSLHRKGSSSRKSPSSSRHRLSSSTRGSSAFGSLSREVMALPIEIPESVTDEDAFRRYLSRSESSMESLGYSGSAAPLAKNLTILASHSIQKRTMALSQAIMTLALLSASASQLRFVVAYASAQTYPALNYFLICTCIVIEILVGIGYVVLSRFDFSEPFVEKVHSYLIFGLFVVAVSNVMIAAFALDDHVCGEGAGTIKKKETYDTIDQGAVAAAPVAPPRPPPP